MHSGGGASGDIDELRAGASIPITTHEGTLRYQVTVITVYRKRAPAKYANRVFDQKAPGRLVLITCEDWDGKAYLSNAVIHAKRVA